MIRVNRRLTRRVPNPEWRARELMPRACDPVPCTPGLGPRARAPTQRTRALTPRARDLTPRARDLMPRARDLDRRARDLSPRARDLT